MTIRTNAVHFQREIPAMTGRRLRALLHQAWIDGNESYKLHESPAGLEERNQFIADLLLREGLAKPKDETNELL